MSSAEGTTLGALLGRFRTEAGVSQVKMARLMKMSRQGYINWENGVYTPRRELILDLARHLRLNDQKRDQLLKAADCAPVGTIWKLPLKPNPFFTGREDVLRELAERLVSDQTVTLKQPQALKGLGGVGKTALAVEYAHRYRDAYQAILWAPASTAERLNASLVVLAEDLRLPEKGVQKQEDIIRAVKRWLLDHTDWLLILDDVEEWTCVEALYPWAQHGHVIITTRAQFTGSTLAVALECLAPGEGALLLLRRAKRLAPEEGLEAVPTEDQTQAKELSETLGGLPLALDQAGAFVEETRHSLAEYQALFEHARGELLRRRGMQATEHLDSVAVTFELAWTKVHRLSPAAGELLRLCAFLAPAAIPEELFIERSDELPPALRATLAQPLGWHGVVSILRRYSLIEREGETQTLSQHRLVQAVLREELDQDTQRAWADRVVRVVNRVFPAVEFPTWARCQRLIVQAQTCAELIAGWGFIFPEASRLLHLAGLYLYERAAYAEALPLFEQELAIDEQALGPDHPDVATTLNNLAELYRAQGQSAEALLLSRRALKIREQALGPDHPDVAQSMNNLAELYRAQGQYEQALPLFQRALAILEQARGPNHSDLATILNNLAELYRERGQYNDALSLFQRALKICEQALEPDDPDVARSLNNLASLYLDQGQYEQALPLFQRALAIFEQALGPNHPNVASGLSNLACLYVAQGQYEQALPRYERALAIWEQALGPDHPTVAIGLKNLADLLRQMNRLKEAVPLEARAQAIRARHRHPS